MSRVNQHQLAGVGMLACGAAVLLLALVSFREIGNIPVSRFGGPVGPRSFPLLVSGALALAGAALVFDGLRRRLMASRGALPDEGEPMEGRPVPIALFLVGLALNFLLVQPLGFPIASAALMVCVAAAFDDRRFLRSGLIGLAFGSGLFFCFQQFLGLRIGTGPLGTMGQTLLGIS